MLVNARYANVLLNNPLIANVIAFDKERKHKGIVGLQKIINQLKTRKYDTAIVLPGSVRTAFAVYRANIPRRIGSDQSTGMSLWNDVVKFPNEVRSSFDSSAVQWLESVWKFFGGTNSVVSVFFTDVVPLDRTLHASARYCRLLHPLGVKEDTVELPKLFPAEEDRKVVDEILTPVSRDNLVIGIAPGSVWKTKRWHEESFARTMKKIQENMKKVFFVFIGGSEDRDICLSVRSLYGRDNAINTSGQLTPLQSAELLRRCKVLLTNDSAAMHLASAVGTRCVALLGPTIPAFGFRPLGEEHIIIEQQGLWCRPCTPHGGHRCPIGTHECMKSIALDDVLQAVVSLCEKK
jgi:heptosyltransferase-2